MGKGFRAKQEKARAPAKFSGGEGMGASAKARRNGSMVDRRFDGARGEGITVVVEPTKNNEARTIMKSPASSLKRMGLANRETGEAQGEKRTREQPPEAVMRAIVAAYVGAPD
ncbi:MAG: hypothetical protein LBM92_01255 [Opitutaceae bacterium]|jgi:hypothetical protein|nr:hypothetical protein [Opitutaceae bacterium]